MLFNETSNTFIYNEEHNRKNIDLIWYNFIDSKLKIDKVQENQSLVLFNFGKNVFLSKNNVLLKQVTCIRSTILL